MSLKPCVYVLAPLVHVPNSFLPLPKALRKALATGQSPTQSFSGDCCFGLY